MTTIPETNAELAARAQGYWKCRPCGYIGEPLDVGEHNQRCAHCNEYAVEWIVPVAPKVAQVTAPITREQLEESAPGKDAPIHAQAKCHVCGHSAFILIRVWAGHLPDPNAWMCRACLGEQLKASGK